MSYYNKIVTAESLESGNSSVFANLAVRRNPRYEHSGIKWKVSKSHAHPSDQKGAEAWCPSCVCWMWSYEPSLATVNWPLPYADEISAPSNPFGWFSFFFSCTIFLLQRESTFFLSICSSLRDSPQLPLPQPVPAAALHTPGWSEIPCAGRWAPGHPQCRAHLRAWEFVAAAPVPAELPTPRPGGRFLK